MTRARQPSARRHVRSVYERIYRVVARIPRGRVLTYGQVADLAGLPNGARVVGHALHASLSDRPLPWQRVLGRRGPERAAVTIKDPIGAALQRQLLEAEGVRFDRDTVDLRRHAAPHLRRQRVPRI